MKKIWAILVLSLLCAFCSVNFIGCGNNDNESNESDKTLYTQTISVIFVVKTGHGTVSSINYSIAYFDTAKTLLLSPTVIDKADEIYLQAYEKYNNDMRQYNEYGGIKANSIDILHGGETVLIISYKDYDANVASKKLDAVIQAAQIGIQKCFSDLGTAELITITTEHYCNI